MPETLSKTTAGTFAKGSVVNLERSLKFGDSIDGHFVEGHVDTRGRVMTTVELGKSREIIVASSKTLARHVVLHGSVAINGVSLTVARKRGTSFTVAVIPHTLTHTNLYRLGVGDMVNIETDHGLPHGVAGRVRGGTVRRNAKNRIRKGL